MIDIIDLSNHFSGLTKITDQVFRCLDVLPKVTYYYYVKLGDTSTCGSDLLAVSENEVDDEFVLSFILDLRGPEFLQALSISDLPINPRGFDKLVLAPSSFHSYFKGRLDKKRDRLVLCLPCFTSEFSGTETPREFMTLCQDIVPTRNWKRGIHPKIALRFDNPRTRGGTGNAYVFAKYGTVINELEKLDGVKDGFLEVINFKGDVIEVISAGIGDFIVIRGRDDSARASIVAADLPKYLWLFLTSG